MRSPTAILALLAGCSPGVSGQIVDAATGAPVAGATVEVVTVGLGTRDGQLVWDKAHVESTRADAQGRFALDVDGGVNLRASAAGYPRVETSLCSRSPMLVRIGGPFKGKEPEHILALQTGWSFDRAAEAETAVADLLLAGRDGRRAWLRAPLGLAFVAGTGKPPSPPTAGYSNDLTLDLLDCGWLFVRTRGNALAAVRTGSFGIEHRADGDQLSLSYALLPAR